MAGEKPLPTEVDERIQQLAGDIYVQVEESILSLLESQKSAAEITEEDVVNHPTYQALAQSNQKQLKKSESAAQKFNKTIQESETQLA